jgi:acetyl-CoA carboxylase biotin carboxylase subunit
MPLGGHGVRVDSHVYGGYTVSPYYDSMIAKLVTYGRTRKIALDRMYRALSEYIIRGIDTNIEFLKAIVLDPGFRQGEATTSYVEEFLARAPKDVFKKSQ